MEIEKQIHVNVITYIKSISRFTALDLFDDLLVDLLATGPLSESRAAPNIVNDPSHLDLWSSFIPLESGCWKATCWTQPFFQVKVEWDQHNFGKCVVQVIYICYIYIYYTNLSFKLYHVLSMFASWIGTYKKVANYINALIWPLLVHRHPLGQWIWKQLEP